MNPKLLYGIGAAAGLIALAGSFFAPVAMLAQAYHFAVLVCLQPLLGCLLLILIFQTTSGKWGRKILPVLMTGCRLIPWCLLGLLPVILLLPMIYHWHGVGDRAVFLNRTFFAIRIVIYWIIFGGMSLLIGRGKRLGAGGLIVYMLTGYFMAIDLVMAIDPEWYSSGFPVVFMTNQAVMGLALGIVFQSATRGEIDQLVWRDLGSLLLAMVVFWSYVAFTQFLIIWMGNLPKEIHWYVLRGRGFWRWVTIFIAAFNLFAPFFVLLSRAVKDNPRRLGRVALVVLACQVIYLYWLVAPSLPDRSMGGVHWLDPLVLAALGAPLAGVFITWNRRVSIHE